MGRVICGCNGECSPVTVCLLAETRRRVLVFRINSALKCRPRYAIAALAG